MTSPKEELHSTITARAELDRQFARLLVEDSAAVMSRNMLHILNQLQQHADEQEVRFTAVVKAELTILHTDIRSQETAIHELESKLDTAIDDMHKRVDEIDARHSQERRDLSAKVDELRAKDAARLPPTEVRRLVAQIEQHDTELAQIKAQLGLVPDE